MIFNIWAFSDTFEHKLKLAITSWARFCLMEVVNYVSRRQRRGVEYPSLPCIANCLRISKTLA